MADENPNNPPPVVPPVNRPAPNSNQDPLNRMVDIATNKELAPDDKKLLLEHSASRFKHRRRIAYMAFTAILISLALLFIAAFLDGSADSQTSVLKKISESQVLIGTIEGFLTAIVAAYYGTTTLRPSS